MQPGNKVIAPLGIATVVGKGLDNKWVIRYSKADYKPLDWLKISPGNGLCVFRVHSEGELTCETSTP